MKPMIAAAVFLVVSLSAFGEWNELPAAGMIGDTILAPVTTDAYGPGTHSDATGRAFTFRAPDGDRVQDPVERDGYGPGVHMDQYGRPVRATPAFEK